MLLELLRSRSRYNSAEKSVHLVIPLRRVVFGNDSDLISIVNNGSNLKKPLDQFSYYTVEQFSLSIYFNGDIRLKLISL